MNRVKEWNMPSVAITDYGNIFGAVEFFDEAERCGIQPILGCEVFIPSYDNHKIRQYKRGQDFYFQLVLLVMNDDGYRNLSRLLTESCLHGFYYKPRVDSELLKQYSNGLIALSSGFNSEIDHHLANENRQQAVLTAQKYGRIFPNRFYLELQDNGIAGQNKINAELCNLGKECGIPLVATGNVHYLNRDDAEAFDVLRSIQMARTMWSPREHLQFSTDGYYFKSTDEMRESFASCEEALAATAEIASQCRFHFPHGSYHLPHYDIPAGKTLDAYLYERAMQGFEGRWPQIKKVSTVTDEDKPRYLNRIEHELKVIQKMGFSGYFLIVADFINWAKENGIPVGPGRGSGAGSLAAYCLRITDLDPLPYNLLFERFLNPERVGMPDFDVDFCQDRRGEVIEYVSKKYGNVSQIITFGKMKARAVIRDVGRVMGLDYDFVDKIAKMVPAGINVHLADALKQDPDLKELHEKNDQVKKLITTSLKLEGLCRHASVHAAGVIITDKPLWNFVPLYKGSREEVVVQFDMKSAEKIGLIKFDFLGLKTLTVIDKALKNIKSVQGTEIDISQIPLDDKKVYQELSRGNGIGVFQLESSGMRDVMARLKPSGFEDIIALVALYRPGPMDLIPDFIERKHGRQKVDDLDERLKSVLGSTYGIMVYQEQVMQIASLLANYSLGEADILRHAMGKKKVEEMAAQREFFRQGAQKNGMDIKQADQIFALMEKFAGYGFNKSHAAAYALVSYQTAWLKTHYVTEYMAALMSTEMENTDKLQVFLNDSRQHQIKILPPDVNFSRQEFTVVAPMTIRYGLGALKGVGSAAIDSIVQARTAQGAFKSFYNFCLRVDLRRITKKVIEVLVKAGACDGFGIPRQGMAHAIDKMSEAAARMQKNQEAGQSDLFFEMDAASVEPAGIAVNTQNEWSQSEKLKYEKEVFGFYFSAHPLQSLKDSLKQLTTHTTTQLRSVTRNGLVTVGGTITSLRPIVTKNGEKMAFVQLEDLEGSVEIVLFPRVYKKHGHLVHADEPVTVTGTVDLSDEGAKIIGEGVESLSESLKNKTKHVCLTVPCLEFTSHKLKQVLAILGSFKGQSLVRICLDYQSSFQVELELPGNIRAAASDELQHQINQLFERKVVSFQ